MHKQFETLRLQRGTDQAHTCNVAAGSVEARYETRLDRIGGADKDDRDRVGGRFRGFRRIGAAPGENDSDVSSNQLVGQGRQLVVVTLRPAIFDDNIPTFRVPIFLQASTERGAREIPRRQAVKKTNDRHGGLLRAHLARHEDGPTA